jgi:hypothetical protein
VIGPGDARRLGCSLLTHTMENRHEIGLGSYDRLFPNQDTMPKGGFGNLIALPLQKRPRENKATVRPVVRSDRASWTEKQNGLEGASSKPFQIN